MKHFRPLCLTALLGAAVPLGAGAQTAPTNINPAQLYYQAFLVAPDLPQADSDYLWTNEWQGRQLPERFGKIMASYDNEFRLLRAAAWSPCCSAQRARNLAVRTAALARPKCGRSVWGPQLVSMPQSQGTVERAAARSRRNSLS